MKKINIFIASSIVEFATERMQIELFIRNVSDKFEDRYNVKLQPILCENLDDVYSVARKQEEYNGKIRESEFCFFIFFTKAGKYTREEFDVARKQFEETGKPKIYTYFKVIEEGVTAEQSVRDFMDELDHTFGHYYGSFSHIDTLKLRILLSLKLQEMDFLEIKTEGGKCIVDGREVLKLDNVSEFANNRDLAELQRELAAVEAEYYDLRVKYDKGDCTDEIYRKYCAAASKRQNLIDEIDDLQRAIFNVSLRMVNDDVHGEISDKQKKAYRLFETGDHEGALSILNSEDIDNEFLRRRQRRLEEDIADCKKYIKEHKTAIDILQTMKKYDGRFAEIEERYEKIAPVIFEMNLELDTAYAYVKYLIDQNKDSKSLPIAEQLLELYEDDVDKAKVLNLLGVICDNLHQRKEAENFYLKSIEIRERLVIDNPNEFSLVLAISYDNFGTFITKKNIDNDAKMYLLKAIEICEKLDISDPNVAYTLAICYDNTGHFYEQLGKFSEEKKFYLKAIKIFEMLATDNPDKYNNDLAISYTNMARICTILKLYDATIELLSKANHIIEKLAKDNPDRYLPRLAGIYNDFANAHIQFNRPDKAEFFCINAIKIHEELSKKFHNKYDLGLAIAYNNAGMFHSLRNEVKEAEEMYFNSIKIRKQLALDSPDKFTSYLAKGYLCVGAFYVIHKDYTNAEKFYFWALRLYEQLYKVNPDKFNSSLGDCYISFWYLYKKQGKETTAKLFTHKVINAYEKSIKNNPTLYIPTLVTFYLDCAGLEDDETYFDKALELAKEYPDHPICRQIIEALTKK